MLRFKLSTHFALLTLCVGAVTIRLDPTVGAAYLVACTAILLPLTVLRVPPRFFYVVLFAAVAVWLTHLLRAPMLLVLPESARFPRIVQITPEIATRVLYQIGLYGLLLVVGFTLGLRTFARRDAPGPGNTAPGPPFLVRASFVMALLCAAVLVARVVFQLALGLNTKFVPNPTTGFLQRVLPDGLIYPVALLYLVKYRHRVSPFETTVFGASIAGLTLLVTLSGSRQAFAAIALALFIFFLSQRGNFRIGFVRGWAMGIVGAWLLLLTFTVAAPLRDYLELQGGYGDEVVDVMFGGAMAAFEPETFLVNGSLVSKRISGGFDGMVAVNMSQPQLVTDAFSPRRTAQIVLAKLVPRYGADEEMVTGKALAVAYGGRSLEDRQASAVGLFAALRLTFGPIWSFPAALILGILGAAYFAVAERVRDADLAFLLHFIGMQQVVVWILSGNFDIVIPGAIRVLVYVVVYGAFAALVATAARAGSMGAATARSPDEAPAI